MRFGTVDVADPHLAEGRIHVGDEALRDQARKFRVVAGLVHEPPDRREEMQRQHLEAALQRVRHAVGGVERRMPRRARRRRRRAPPPPRGRAASVQKREAFRHPPQPCHTRRSSPPPLQRTGDAASKPTREGPMKLAAHRLRRRCIRLRCRARPCRLRRRDAQARLRALRNGAAAGPGRRAARAGADRARHPLHDRGFRRRGVLLHLAEDQPPGRLHELPRRRPDGAGRLFRREPARSRRSPITACRTARSSTSCRAPRPPAARTSRSSRRSSRRRATCRYSALQRLEHRSPAARRGAFR